MQGNFTAVKRNPATIEECVSLVSECHKLWYMKTQMFTEPGLSMIDQDDLDASRTLLENIRSAWRH
jgi:hypothetical protein